MKKVLDVPFYSQFIDVRNKKWQDKACGIVSLAMILKFYGKKPDCDKLIKDAIAKKGYIGGIGWVHEVLAELAKTRNLKAMRAKDLSFRDIINKINRNEPVIASVHKNFNPKNSGHLVVITGYGKNGNKYQNVFVNDPYGKTERFSNLRVPYCKFTNSWTRRAIFFSK